MFMGVLLVLAKNWEVPKSPYLGEWLKKLVDRSILLLLLLLRGFSCVRLCDPIDGSPPGCPIPGILQARTLEWVAISFSKA